MMLSSGWLTKVITHFSALLIITGVFAPLLPEAYGQSTGGIKLVQHGSIYPGTTTSASLAFASGNTAGNWIAVCIRAGFSSSQVFQVTDSTGNAYRPALQLGMTNPYTFAIFYAENINGGANTVSVSDSVSAPLR